jgi:hypothetical protein
MYACPAMVTGVVSQVNAAKNDYSQNTLLMKAVTNLFHFHSNATEYSSIM